MRFSVAGGVERRRRRRRRGRGERVCSGEILLGGDGFERAVGFAVEDEFGGVDGVEEEDGDEEAGGGGAEAAEAEEGAVGHACG